VNHSRIKTLIVDDEVLARKFIRRLLNDDADVDLIGECKNGKEAIGRIQTQCPDLVFLDVQMPEVDGFAVLEAVGIDRLPQIVFTTAYEQYALRAFELHAIDYLLKPFDQARFANMMEHAKERVFHRQRRDEKRQMGTFLQDVRRPGEYLKRFTLRSEGRLTFLTIDDLTWIQADDKYVHLHTGKAPARMIRQSLHAMETQLDPRRFVRIHRGAIVNIERIKELHPLFGGEHQVLLDDGTTLTLSRNYKDRLFQVLGKPL
jgi:two-component system LytT family response regulator